jgi:hypothetical protein
MVKPIKVGTLIRVDGTVESFIPSKGQKFSLEEVQKLVGGYVERLSIPESGGSVMLVDEDGISRGLPLNPNASEVAGRRIYGEALLLPRGMGW